LEADAHCIREQNEWLATTYRADRGDREGPETRGELWIEQEMDELGDAEEIEEIEGESSGYSRYEASNASPVPNEHDNEIEGHRYVSSENLTIEQQDRYARDLVKRAAEYGMTPGELHQLNEDCLREQQEWLAEAGIERKPRDELGEYTGREDEVQRGTHDLTTTSKPLWEAYEGSGMADEPPNPTTSFNDYATAINPEHDDEAYAHAPVHAMHAAVERQVDDIASFENEDATLWHERRAANEAWADANGAWPNPQEEVDFGGYTATNYPSPPPPTPWYPPQPPTTSHRPRRHRFRPERPRPRHQRDEVPTPTPTSKALPNPPSNCRRRIRRARTATPSEPPRPTPIRPSPPLNDVPRELA
jgi:hypothetical protein